MGKKTQLRFSHWYARCCLGVKAKAIDTKMEAKGGLRPILDLQNLNEYLKKLKFRMVSLASIIPSLDLGDWHVALDLKGPHFHRERFQGHRRFLQFTVGPDRYQFVVLPFGLATAPRVFAKCMSVVAAYLRRRGIQISPYLNDWLVKGCSRSQVQRDVVVLHADPWACW
ncbi:hypothetical protein G0U57_001825 [Chelydra serpentina]|uniref:ribonuclease H n=1 Tax=Chelydra serpentina TaxID=8475 RepID=A0A8T1SRV7_CHESE|nr:hypothetical protein G0U57_001825 [Chelydra serpentina]